MTLAVQRRSAVRGQLEAYEESWNQAHDAAMMCRDLEDTIAVGVSVFNLLREREDRWRERVYRGAIPFTHEDDADYRRWLASWMNVTHQVLDTAVPPLEKQFGKVQGGDALRQAAAVAQKALEEWKSPRITRLIGLREIMLPPEAVAEMRRILEEAKQNPAPPLTGPKMRVVSREEFLALKRRS